MFRRVWKTGKRRQIELIDDLTWRLCRVGQRTGEAVSMPDLPREFRRVHQVKRLRDARLGAALAFTDAEPLGTTEDFKKIRRHAVVPHLDRAVAQRPAIELFRHTSCLADRVNKNLRRHRFVDGV